MHWEATLWVDFEWIGLGAGHSGSALDPWERLRTLRGARWRARRQRGDPSGPVWHELAGTFGWQAREPVAEGAVRLGVEWLSTGRGREVSGLARASPWEDAG